MKFVFRNMAAAVALMVSGAPVLAQDGVFSSYNDMRETMDQLIQTRNIQDLMIRFGGADEMTIEQLNGLDSQVEQLYPQDLENAAVIRRVAHENGFSQELIAYWTGTAYLYAYVLIHQVDGQVVAINFRFNSDFSTLNALL